MITKRTHTQSRTEDEDKEEPPDFMLTAAIGVALLIVALLVWIGFA